MSKFDVKEFNLKVAVLFERYLLSMGCFWVLNFMVFLPIFLPKTLPYVQFLSSSWFQAIALPALGVSGSVQANKIWKLIVETHKATMDMHHLQNGLLNALHQKHDALHKHQRELHTKLDHQVSMLSNLTKKGTRKQKVATESVNTTEIA